MALASNDQFIAVSPAITHIGNVSRHNWRSSSRSFCAHVAE